MRLYDVITHRSRRQAYSLHIALSLIPEEADTIKVTDKGNINVYDSLNNLIAVVQPCEEQ